MKKLQKLSLSAAALAFGLSTAAPVKAEESNPERMNVVLIFVDDLGYGDLGFTGSSYAETPHLNAFAAENLFFTDAYAASPHCSPSRAALVTGQFPGRLHLTHWIGGKSVREFRHLELPEEVQYLSSDIFTIGKYFQSQGYTTAQVGKWHLGGRRVPVQEHGFDQVLGWAPGAAPGPPRTWYAPFATIADITDAPEGQYITDRLTDEAIGFMTEQRERPFFLLLQHYALHTPLTAPEEIVQKYVDRGRPRNQGRENATILAMKETMDTSVGRILAALDDLGLADNTIVIFTSDNGGVPYLSNNAPFRLGKKHLQEGGIRVPTMMRVPNLTPKGGKSAVPINTVDWFPTLVDLTGGDIDSLPTTIDGISIRPILDGSGDLDRDALYWHISQVARDWADIPPMGAVRMGSWKFIHYYGDTKPDELYNLDRDPGENRNLARSNPERVAQMRAMLERHLDEIEAQRPKVK